MLNPIVTSLLWIVSSAALAQAPPVVVHPLELSRTQIAEAEIFKDFSPVIRQEQSERGSFRTEDVERYLSPDRQFDFGMYRAGPNRFTIENAYGVDEFMYFVEGSVTLTSADGTVQVIEAGEAVLIPRDWTGVWETEGYTKIYVIYSPDGPIE